jgi:hypothetical protein
LIVHVNQQQSCPTIHDKSFLDPNPYTSICNFNTSYTHLLAPLLIDLNLWNGGSIYMQSGIKNTLKYQTIYWYQIPLYHHPIYNVSFDITLYEDNTFRFNYYELPNFNLLYYNTSILLNNTSINITLPIEYLTTIRSPITNKITYELLQSNLLHTEYNVNIDHAFSIYSDEQNEWKSSRPAM